MSFTKRTLARTVASIGSLALGACSMAPAYHRPTPIPAAPGERAAALPGSFKAAPGWVVAVPADDVAKGEWWKLFGDPVLDGLEERVAVTNQNVAAARAAWLQAGALVREDRAALFPTVGVNGGATHTGTFGNGATVNGAGVSGGGANGASTAGSSFTAQATASWAPDLWGKLGDTVRQAKASAQASAADLANATLSARATLASDYFQLRGVDAQAALLDETIAAYTRSLTVTRNKYAAGTVGRADVYSAEATLSNAQASRRDLDRQRAALEDAVAVLAGENPSTFHIAPAAWAPVMPEVPGVVPAQVLQRRPDIAAAERSVAAANAGIGIQRAAFFPAVTLNGAVGSTSSALSGLFGAATSFWSLGGTVAETLLDFGARSARVSEARQQYNGAVATYRQTVLGAFQQVEDNLAALAAYRDQHADLARSADAATHAEAITRAEYQAGTVDYTTVAVAQASAATARQAEITNVVNRQGAAVSLIAAIGGEWSAAGAAGG